MWVELTSRLRLPICYAKGHRGGIKTNLPPLKGNSVQSLQVDERVEFGSNKEDTGMLANILEVFYIRRII